MIPTVLISGTIAAETTRQFSLPDGRQPCTLYAKGLAGAEVINIRVIDSGGAAVPWYDNPDLTTLSATHNVRSLIGPGEFEVMCDSSAGDIEVGLYGAL